MPADPERNSTLSTLQSLVTPLLIIDSVFRGFALLGLLSDLSTNLPSIGAWAVFMKALLYIVGIVANVAVLQRKLWGSFLAFGVAAVGIWFVLIDAWSLLHALLRKPFSSAIPKTLLLSAVAKTTARAVWQAVYVTTVWLAFREQSQQEAEQ